MDMAATTAQPVLGRSASSRNYQSPADPRHRRTASGSGSGAGTRASSDTHRVNEQSSSTNYHARATSSHSQHLQHSLNAASRRDQESPNLPQTAPQAASTATARRSSSRDQSNGPSSPGQRRDAPPSSHYRNESRSSRNRYSTEAPRGPPPAAVGAMNSTPRQPHGTDATTQGTPQRPQGRRTLDMPETGSWELLKTIGAGSMGKVKLARNRLTGEHVRWTGFEQTWGCGTDLVASAPSRLFRDSRQKNIAAKKSVSGQTTQRTCERLARLRLSNC